MRASAATILLLEALEAQEVLTLRGFTTSIGDANAVVIERWGHMRGLWRVQNSQYVWTGAASSQPAFAVANVEGAVAYTLGVIAAG